MAEFEPRKKAKTDTAGPPLALAQVVVKNIAGDVVDKREVNVTETAAQLKAAEALAVLATRSIENRKAITAGLQFLESLFSLL